MKVIEGYDVKIFTDNIEGNALEQIKELLTIDVFSDKKIRIMPDVHAGAGCVIGFTGDLGDKVIPNIVGVDIGCGMRILNLGKLVDIDYHAFHEHIRGNVPSGKFVREDKFGFKPLVGEEMEIYSEAKKLVTELYCYRELKDTGRLNKSIGTLGGGNHFIELDKDEEENVYLVIHTGSRNLGKQVAEIYQAKAVKHLTTGADEFEDTIKRTIEEYKAAGRRSELQTVIKKMRTEHEVAQPALPTDLCYVEGEAREHYLHDMRICQRWAVLNRKLISLLLIQFFPAALPDLLSPDRESQKGKSYRRLVPASGLPSSWLRPADPRCRLQPHRRLRKGIFPPKGNSPLPLPQRRNLPPQRPPSLEYRH